MVVSDWAPSRQTTEFVDSLVTFSFSALSVCGSFLVLLSYYSYHSVLAKDSEVTRTCCGGQTNTKNFSRAAYLIFHLAISDLIWFLSALVESGFWLFTTNARLPTGLCYLCSPVTIFTRMSSLIWTCIISYNILSSVCKRYRTSPKKISISVSQRAKFRYYIIVFVISFPGTALNIVRKSMNADTNFGCKPGYESLGQWYEVFVTEFLPIFSVFCVNLFVYYRVRAHMHKKSFPLSVRKRRRRIMYHYVMVAILCWAPTIIDYMLEICGVHSPSLEIVARASLYSSGFLNFLVFGMQDPHLQRSLVLIYYRLKKAFSLWSASTPVAQDESLTPTRYSSENLLKTERFLKRVGGVGERCVMFSSADEAGGRSRGKKHIYRFGKLSAEEKALLYVDRPDLDKSKMNDTSELCAAEATQPAPPLWSEEAVQGSNPDLDDAAEEVEGDDSSSDDEDPDDEDLTLLNEPLL